MEKHHKLRRPAGSSIHACNICGIEGHQAANCTNGTVNWAQKWGPSAFASTGLGESTLPKEPDYKDLAAQAKAFAAKRLAEEEAAKKKAEGGGDDGDDGDARRPLPGPRLLWQRGQPRGLLEQHGGHV